MNINIEPYPQFPFPISLIGLKCILEPIAYLGLQKKEKLAKEFAKSLKQNAKIPLALEKAHNEFLEQDKTKYTIRLLVVLEAAIKNNAAIIVVPLCESITDYNDHYAKSKDALSFDELNGFLEFVKKTLVKYNANHLVQWIPAKEWRSQFSQPD